MTAGFFREALGDLGSNLHISAARTGASLAPRQSSGSHRVTQATDLRINQLIIRAHTHTPQYTGFRMGIIDAAHTHTLSLFLSHTQTLPLSLSLSLSHTNTEKLCCAQRDTSRICMLLFIKCNHSVNEFGILNGANYPGPLARLRHDETYIHSPC